MKIHPNSATVRHSLILCALILAVAAFRMLRATAVPELPNFSPVMAIAFGGGLLLPGVVAWMLPLGALFVSDIVLNLALGYPLVSAGQIVAWACMIAAVGTGRWLAGRGSVSLGALAGGLLANAVVFYLVTNAVSWLVEPAYARSIGGLVQALTTGLPGFPPSWVFFRNAVAGDFLFAALMLGAWTLAAKRPRLESAPVAA